MLSIALALLLTETPLSQGEIVFRSAAPSVCRIETRTATEGSIGSGFVLAKDRVATAWHVVWDAEEIWLSFPGQVKKMAKVVDANSKADLAILAIEDAPKPLQNNRKRPEPGETLYAIGAPKDLTGSIVEGLMSQARAVNGVTVYQISNPVTHGYSGGPVLNKSGQVVGMVSWGYAGEGSLNFAVPVATILGSSLTETPTPIGDFREKRMANLLSLQCKWKKGDEFTQETKTSISVDSKVVDRGLSLHKEEVIDAQPVGGATVRTTFTKYLSIDPKGAETQRPLPEPKTSMHHPLPGFKPEAADNVPPDMQTEMARFSRISQIYRAEDLGGIVKEGQSWSVEIPKATGTRFIPAVRFEGKFLGFETFRGVRTAKLQFEATEKEGGRPMSAVRTVWYGPGLVELRQLHDMKNVPTPFGIADALVDTNLVLWRFAPKSFLPSTGGEKQ
ncbi:MAG: serine protease [Armatimonadetes bacterium]|nr:serine protease [Armatimonadota bacterium]